MRKVIAIGETILDIIFKNDQPMIAQPGGSALNTLISLGRLDIPVYFVGELAKDATGDVIVHKMEQNNVAADYLKRYEKGQSGLGLAFLDKENEAKYSFYKNLPRQRLDGKLPVIEKDDIVLFGSFYGLQKEVRKKVLGFIQYAIKNEAIIIYDPNFRESHLDELPELFESILENMTFADILRGSHEDFHNIFKTDSAKETYQIIKDKVPVLLYTNHAEGVFMFSQSTKYVKKITKTNTISTVGAGDSFNAGVIYGLLIHDVKRSHINKSDQQQWHSIINLGLEFAADACQSYENYISWEFASQLKSKQ